jgi:hypothetical protein
MTNGSHDTPAFVHSLPSGVEPTDESVALDPEIERDVAHRLQEISEAQAEAAVSGRDYLIT